MRSLWNIAFSSILLAGVACTVTSTGGPPGSGPGTAPPADVDRCKRSCDKMKFFACSSADEQARCYADCDTATASQIEVFTGCAESSICDPACRTKIQPAEQASQGGGGASAATCTTACDKLVMCSLIPVGAKTECNKICAEKGYQYQIDCVNETACDKIEATCGGPVSNETGGGGGSSGGGADFEIANCRTQCDSIHFFDCSTTTEHAACRDVCASAAATKRDTFTACSQSSGSDCTKKGACLDAFLN